MLLIVLGLLAGAALTAAEPLPVRLVTGRSPQVGSWVVRTAQREAEALFRKDGIELQWREDASEGTEALTLVVLFRDSTRFPAPTRREAMGMTFLSEDDEPGRVMVVFWDRMQELVGRGEPRRLGTALGRALAHEIAHSLRRKTLHSREGLLRADFARAQWAAPHRGPFHLAADDAEAIRERLLAKRK